MAKAKYIEAFGAIQSPYDIRDYRGVATKTATATSFPKEFELSLCSVRNQGSVGACVAFSLCGLVEYFNKVQEDSAVTFSTNFIYGNRRNSSYNGIGMVVRDALSNLITYGNVPSKKMSGNVEVPDVIETFESSIGNLTPADYYPNRISSYYTLKTDDDIKASLLQNGPVVFVVPWYDDTHLADDNCLSHTLSSYSSSHCMLIYGWNERGWKIRNSWGTGWGNKGNAILPYSYTRLETYGVTDTVVSDLKKSTIYQQLQSTYEVALEDLAVANDELAKVKLQLEESQQEFTKLLNSIGNINQDELTSDERIIALKDAITALQNQVAEKDKSLQDTLDKVKQLEQEKLGLENKLLEIEQKSSTKFMQIIFKAINAVVNFIKAR